jgi:class 3 adenylate cyclase
LEDFLVSQPLSVDIVCDDGWGAPYPIKGRELEATILFADIASFSARTKSLSSTETLAFVNHFFCWITAEALAESHAVVDKYIGDEIMLVFAREFGSDDPFWEAVTVARRFGDHDVFNFNPHMGIASGMVTVGYVGTPLKYSCSAFGHPVALAARCASWRPQAKISAPSIVFPAAEWTGRDFDRFFPPRSSPPDSIVTVPSSWHMYPPESFEPKNMDPISVVCVERQSMWISMTISAEKWAQDAVRSDSDDQNE